ncbi:MAG: hypothetical protein AAFZ63_06585 [Bacteroidota bacterium]
MKNVAYLCFLLWASLALFSCEKDAATPAGNRSEDARPTPTVVTELITDQETLLRALSQWVATPEAKQWLKDRANPNSRNGRPILDETLLLEVACGPEGAHFVQIYNALSNEAHSTSSFSDYIQTENPLLALKFDTYFDDFLGQMDRFTPLVSDQNRSVSYLDGQAYDIEPALTATGGAMIIDFRLTEAANRVLFDPGTNSFNRDLPYPFCSDQLFIDRLRELPDPVCSGQIPLSITEHVQAIFYEACTGGGFTFGGGDEICGNGIDDDEDGLVDCDDPDCCGTEGCGSCVETDCNDGIDNDGDGLVDEDDLDCFVDSPCMRDHYMDNNFFSELELVRPQVLAEMGNNLCNGTIAINSVYENYPNLLDLGELPMFPDYFNGVAELEEWYTFLVKIHWGTPNGSDGIFQDLVYTVHLFELANAPEFHLEQFWTIHGGIAVLIVDRTGLTDPLPVSMGMIPFYSASDACGANNWDPSLYGDIVALSIHEGDPCTLRETDGTTVTNTTQRSYSSGFTIRLGAGIRNGNFNASGGFLYSRRNTYATSESNQITSQYVTNFSDDFYLGRINYSYCWQDQGTTDQIHEMAFGNTMKMRILSQICQ